jgi:hypothetical protein
MRIGEDGASSGKPSVSQGGLASLDGAGCALPLPLSVVAFNVGALEAHSSVTCSSEASCGRCEGSLSSAVSEDVAAVRNGRSNASWMRRTLTWPKPGSEESLSDVAVAILAKLCRVGSAPRVPTCGTCVHARRRTCGGSRRPSCSLC